jgi:hypothetical protein
MQATQEVLGLCVLWGSKVLPTEYQFTAFLPSVGNLACLLLDGGLEALQLSGIVGRVGLLCTTGGRPSGVVH